MTTIPMVKAYIDQLCKEIGTSADAIYSKEADSWYFTQGSAKLQLCFVSYNTVNKTVETYIRVFAPVYPIPTSPDKKLALYTDILELNRQFMGVKFCTYASDGQIYIFTERNINGMDYEEFKSAITDAGYWADMADDELAKKYGPANTAMN